MDVDGTMADYHETLPAFACTYWDIEPPADRWDGSGEMEDWIGITKEQYREAKLAFRQSGLKRSLPIYESVKYVVRQMAREAEVWVATARPWQLLSNLDPDTKEWLRRHQIPHDGLLFGEDKYDRLVESVDPERILIAVEDLPDMFDHAVSLGIPVFQVHRPHNAAHRREPGGQLMDALALFYDRLDDWRSTHGG